MASKVDDKNVNELFEDPATMVLQIRIGIWWFNEKLVMKIYEIISTRYAKGIF